MTCVIPSRHHVNRQAVIQADLRDPAAILAAPETTRLIDFSEPVGLTLWRSSLSAGPRHFQDLAVWRQSVVDLGIRLIEGTTGRCWSR